MSAHYLKCTWFTATLKRQNVCQNAHGLFINAIFKEKKIVENTFLYRKTNNRPCTEKNRTDPAVLSVASCSERACAAGCSVACSVLYQALLFLLLSADVTLEVRHARIHTMFDILMLVCLFRWLAGREAGRAAGTQGRCLVSAVLFFQQDFLCGGVHAYPLPSSLPRRSHGWK